jgi:hypothetical protein
MRTATLALLLVAIALPAAAADRPNIIFIMSDDHAAHAIGAYGSRVNTTPNIDRLAREGMRFDNVFVTNSICTPSRAAILTGQYSHRNGVPVFNRFDSSRQTVAVPGDDEITVRTLGHGRPPLRRGRIGIDAELAASGRLGPAVRSERQRECDGERHIEERPVLHAATFLDAAPHGGPAAWCATYGEQT